MRISGTLGTGVLLLALAGCSGASGDAGRDTKSGTIVPKVGSSNKDAGSGGGGQGTGFGNTDAQPQLSTHPDAAVVDAGGLPPDQNQCGSVEVEPEIKMTTVPGNVLVVFDKSGSMNDPWTTGQSKWTVATQALIQALTPLQDQITAGAIFFPNGADQCAVDPIDSTLQIAFMPGPDFISAWNTFTMANGPNGRTPTGTATMVADAALMAALPTLVGNTTVVLITDGDPNCNTDDTQVNQTVASWLTMGVQTHVLGLPGVAGATDRLNAIATSGGTFNYVDPSDPMALQAEIAKIVSEQVTTNFDSCTIGLPMAPPNPDDVHLVVVQGGVKQDVGRDLGSGGGWTLTPDLSEIVLQGVFCDLAKQGEYDKIAIAFGCVDLPPLPPPKPPS